MVNAYVNYASLISAVILAFITLYYAIITHRILVVNKRSIELSEFQIEAQSRPYVNVVSAVLGGTQLLQLKIANIGKSAANDLQITVEPPFYRFGTKQDSHLLQNLPIFNESVASFGPGVEILVDLGAANQIAEMPEEISGKLPTLNFTSRYSNGVKVYEERTVIDLTIYLMTTPSEHNPAMVLEEISVKVSELVDSVRRLKPE
jgi:hypothetical protein